MSIAQAVMDVILQRRKAKGLSPDGATAIMDSKPVTRHVAHRPAKSMFEIAREAIRSESLARDANRLEKDTFEESQDFGDDEEDMIPETVYERNDRFATARNEARSRREELLADARVQGALDRQLEKARQGGPKEERPAAARDPARPRTAAPASREADPDEE